MAAKIQDLAEPVPIFLTPELDGQAAGPSEAEWRRLLETTADLDAVTGCDLVVETIVENVLAKQPLFAQLEPKVKDGTVLASNTSTIAVARLASQLAAPQRFCGIHFLRPLARSIVEIVRGPQTARATVAAAVAFVESIGKIPLVTSDTPGFAVNRLLVPYVTEGMWLLLEGAPIEAIEDTASQFGMAIGPLALLDEIGLDTALACGTSFASAYPETASNVPLLVSMVKARYLGRKTGSGFFLHRDRSGSRQREPNPAVPDLLVPWAQPRRAHSGESIAARLFLPMLLEATRILQQGVVADARLVDLAAIFGLGFPADRGGLLYWADRLGADRLVELLESLQYIGKRATITPALSEIINARKRFYT